MASMREYFMVIHRHTPHNAVIGLTTIVNTQVHTQWFPPTQLDRLVEAATAADTRANVYARITPLARPPARGRGLERDSLGTSVLWCDYDSYDNPIQGLQTLQSLAQPPTLIVNSGYGLHAYWLLDQFYTDLDAIKARNAGLLRTLNTEQAQIADSCFDLARILRVPDTHNIKREKPALCSVVAYGATRVYRLNDFAPAEYSEKAVSVWDTAALPDDFLETVRERDSKLYKRMFSEETARKADAPLKNDGSIDRSRNDAYIATRLLGIGFSAETALAALMHPMWFCGAKYRETGRYDYVVSTVNAAYRVFINSPDRYFIKSTFQTERFAKELTTEHRFIFVAERLWRYKDGVYLEDGERYIRHEVVTRLGSRWTSRASDEAVRYIMDQAHTPQEDVNQITEHANVLNGMLYLSTCELQPHSARYLSLSQVPALWDPSVKTAAIDRFVAQILPEDAIDTFWEFFGSAFITARHTPKHFLVLCGPSNSGKSKLLELMTRFFGKNNVRAIPFQTLADNKFAAASLYGKMVNIFSDLSQTEANNGDFIKTLTGDDPISGERKFKDWFEFKNTARLAFSANHFPRVRNPDEPYFNRAIVIPCTKVFDRRNADPAIVDKLYTPENASAILLRLVQGWQRLLRNNGLTEAASIIQAGNEYRFQADTVAGFWHSCVFDPNAAVERDTAYQIYRQVCQQANRREVSSDLFFKRTAEMLDRLGMSTSYDVLRSGSINVEPIRKWRYHGRRMPQAATFAVTVK